MKTKLSNYMKTYLECVEEAALLIGDKGVINYVHFSLPQYVVEVLNKAADIYASQSNSHKHGVMQGCLYVRDFQTNNIHQVRKVIWGDDDCSVWCNTWYGRHVIGLTCEFVQQPTVGQRSVGTNAEARDDFKCYESDERMCAYQCDECKLKERAEAPSEGHL